MAENCDFTMAGLHKKLPEAFAQVSPHICKIIIAKVAEQEYLYWSEDEKIDEISAKDSKEECLGDSLFGGIGEESFLEEV